jgi:hypothetical protein
LSFNPKFVLNGKIIDAHAGGASRGREDAHVLKVHAYEHVNATLSCLWFRLHENERDDHQCDYGNECVPFPHVSGNVYEKTN